MKFKELSFNVFSTYSYDDNGLNVKNKNYSPIIFYNKSTSSFSNLRFNRSYSSFTKILDFIHKDDFNYMISHNNLGFEISKGSVFRFEAINIAYMLCIKSEYVEYYKFIQYISRIPSLFDFLDFDIPGVVILVNKNFTTKSTKFKKHIKEKLEFYKTNNFEIVEFENSDLIKKELVYQGLSEDLQFNPELTFAENKVNFDNKIEEKLKSFDFSSVLNKNIENLIL